MLPMLVTLDLFGGVMAPTPRRGFKTAMKMGIGIQSLTIRLGHACVSGSTPDKSGSIRH